MASFQEWTVKEPYLHLHSGLGEGPYYEKQTNTLRWVDIKQKKLHSIDVDIGLDSLKTLQLDVAVTVTADIKGVDPKDKILVGLKYGLAVLDRASGKYEYIDKLRIANPERIRTNDGAIDPNGRFWVGSMTDFGFGDFQPEGALHRFDGKEKQEVVIEGLTIPNSIGWSPDAKTMYYTHSTEGTVYAWDYDVADGSYTNHRVFYKHPTPGHPDGFRVDTDGNLWHAVYGEGRVLKISPEGKVVGEIKLPTPNITCTQFVGTELYCTSASMDEGDEGTEEQRKYGGALFKVDVGARGLDFYEFKL
ncbi:hypothetical protein BN1708_009487 [Verticillium longisporum]|uniref:SMP-30/Gluconolactonase/LRE-like region domain-containing protein n=2 Tax=Verticillium longisporum TaxID=100787 RepID=A0A0G4KHS1_VERLO|nr:Cell growth-regulated gene 1 protein like [Verticillium longisporum]CRJ98732.1 hypothetical protein BN1708_009487 [Verticillium longisporum]